MTLETFLAKFDQFADAPDAGVKNSGSFPPRLSVSAGEEGLARRRRDAETGK
jgi:hypothetical protein